MPQTIGSLPLIDDPHANDIFVDGSAGIHVFNGIARIALETVRVDHSSNPPATSRVLVGRLVMPLAAAESMARAILAMIEQYRDTQIPPAPTSSAIQ
jgi:hypothetical protein